MNESKVINGDPMADEPVKKRQYRRNKFYFIIETLDENEAVTGVIAHADFKEALQVCARFQSAKILFRFVPTIRLDLTQYANRKAKYRNAELKIDYGMNKRARQMARGTNRKVA